MPAILCVYLFTPGRNWILRFALAVVVSFLVLCVYTYLEGPDKNRDPDPHTRLIHRHGMASGPAAGCVSAASGAARGPGSM